MKLYETTEPTIPIGSYEEGKFHCRGFGCGLGEDCPFFDVDNCGYDWRHPIKMEPIGDEL